MHNKSVIYKVATISQLHEIIGFGKPKHPLITVIDYSKVNVESTLEKGSFTCSFYSVNFKKHCSFLYGRQIYDHGEGTLHCTAPDQIISYDRKMEAGSTEGWGLYFHPELIRNTALGKKIHEYTFFLYSENEALHLSEQEKQTLLAVLSQMENEYNTNIDHYSHDLIISNIELLLNYCRRFYGRQFITRRNQSNDLIVKFEKLLHDYFVSGSNQMTGLPTVGYFADRMNVSPNYFSDLLKSETGKSAQEHIHFHLVEKAKSVLLSTDMNINEIAYELGFEYPNNFSKFFKQKTGVSPLKFRKESFKN